MFLFAARFLFLEAAWYFWTLVLVISQCTNTFFFFLLVHGNLHSALFIYLFIHLKKKKKIQVPVGRSSAHYRDLNYLERAKLGLYFRAVGIVSESLFQPGSLFEEKLIWNKEKWILNTCIVPHFQTWLKAANQWRCRLNVMVHFLRIPWYHVLIFKLYLALKSETSLFK